MGERKGVIPPERIHYLSEIAATVQDYHAANTEVAEKLRLCQHLETAAGHAEGAVPRYDQDLRAQIDEITEGMKEPRRHSPTSERWPKNTPRANTPTTCVASPSRSKPRPNRWRTRTFLVWAPPTRTTASSTPSSRRKTLPATSPTRPACSRSSAPTNCRPACSPVRAAKAPTAASTT